MEKKYKWDYRDGDNKDIEKRFEVMKQKDERKEIEKANTRENLVQYKMI